MACYSSLCISNAILNRSPLPNFRLLSFYPLTIVHWSSKLRLSRGAEIPTRSGLPAIALSPLTATLMDLRASVANKRLTAWLSPLDATLTKNRGGGPPPRTFRRSDAGNFRRGDVQTFGRSPSPIAAKRLWCNNSQRYEISSPSGETTPLPLVSKTTRADIGNCPPTLPIEDPDPVGVASRAWVFRSNAQSVLTLDRSAG